MTLSKRGDYVVRSALALARAWPSGETRKIREVVAEMGVPQTFASQILAGLVRHGLASSKAGKDGGYRLSRPPEEISLLEVVEAGEGPLRAERCALGEGPCRWDAVCPLHETWRAATEALRDVLAATDLAALATRDLAMAEGMVVSPADSHRQGGASVPLDESLDTDAAPDALAGALTDPERLAAAIEAAYAEAETLRAAKAPAAAPWSPVHVSATCRRRLPVGVGAADQSPGDELEISWEAAGAATTSHAEVVVDISPAFANGGAGSGARVRLRGSLRPPGEADVDTPGAAFRRRLAMVAVRSLLRGLGHEPGSPPTGRGRGGGRKRPPAPGHGSRS